MNTLDDRLHRAIGDILDLAPPTPNRPTEPTEAPSPYPWFRLAAAAAVVGIGVTGIAVIATRDDNSTVQTTPTMTVGPEAIPADGRLTLDPAPEGHNQGATSGQQSYPSSAETRIYAADHERPERGAAIAVRAAVDSEAFEGDGAEPVTVQSADGFAWTEEDGTERVSFGPIDATVYYLDGYGVTRDELLAAAVGARSTDSDGPTIDQASLPDGVSELAVGSYGESPTFRPFAGDRVVEQVAAHWPSDDPNLHVDYQVLPEYGGLFAANRVGHGEVTNVDVNGHRGYTWVEEFPQAPPAVMVVWTDGERVVFLARTYGGFGV